MRILQSESMIMSIMPQSGQASIPTNMQQLRDLVVSIRTGDAAVSLGSKALTFLGRLVERPEVVAVRTITELGQLLDVNPSTLSRLVRSLGYSGFSGFQRGFCDEVTNSRDRFYSGQALRLLDQLEAAKLRAAAAVLARAGQVRVYGVRQIHAVASLLAYGLGLIRPNVSLLDAQGLGTAESLAQMQKGDVLIVSSVTHYFQVLRSMGK